MDAANQYCRGLICEEKYQELLAVEHAERMERSRVRSQQRRERLDKIRARAVRLCEKRAESLAAALDTVMPTDVIRARWDAYEDAVEDAADVGVRITGYPVIEG